MPYRHRKANGIRSQSRAHNPVSTKQIINAFEAATAPIEENEKEKWWSGEECEGWHTCKEIGETGNGSRFECHGGGGLAIAMAGRGFRVAPSQFCSFGVSVCESVLVMRALLF